VINTAISEILLNGISSTAIPLDVQLMVWARSGVSKESMIFRSMINFVVQERLDSNIEAADTLPPNPLKTTGLRMLLESLSFAKGERLSLKSICERLEIRSGFRPAA
jgi:hypothetical protein